ncbi:MAG: hypothetical protein V8Q75_02595 [Bacilli bacterium]
MSQKGLRKIIIIAILVYLCGLSVSYSLFSETLKINGVARTIDYVAGDDLKVEVVKLNAANNRYSTDTYDFITIDYDREVIENNVFDLYYSISGATTSNKTVTYTIQLTNNTNYTFSNGAITTEITANSKDGLKSTNGSIDKTILKPGETVNVSFVIETKMSMFSSTMSARATVSYTMLGKKRYYYFNVIYER